MKGYTSMMDIANYFDKHQELKHKYQVFTDYCHFQNYCLNKESKFYITHCGFQRYSHKKIIQRSAYFSPNDYGEQFTNKKYLETKIGWNNRCCLQKGDCIDIMESIFLVEFGVRKMDVFCAKCIQIFKTRIKTTW